MVSYSFRNPKISVGNPPTNGSKNAQEFLACLPPVGVPLGDACPPPGAGSESAGGRGNDGGKGRSSWGQGQSKVFLPVCSMSPIVELTLILAAWLQIWLPNHKTAVTSLLFIKKNFLILHQHLVINFVWASFYQNDVFFDYSIKMSYLCLFWGSVQMHSGRHIVNIDFQPMGLKKWP